MANKVPSDGVRLRKRYTGYRDPQINTSTKVLPKETQSQVSRRRYKALTGKDAPQSFKIKGGKVVRPPMSVDPVKRKRVVQSVVKLYADHVKGDKHATRAIKNLGPRVRQLVPKAIGAAMDEVNRGEEEE